MQACGTHAKRGVVVGGGLLGLECAKALRDMTDTHVVEFAPRLMAVQVDDGGGRMLRAKIEALGVTVHTGKNTLEIVDGEAGTHRMAFADGSHLDADMIVFSAGIRARDELARMRSGHRPRAASRSTTRVARAMPISTRSANARPGTGWCTASSPRATTWRAWSRSSFAAMRTVRPGPPSPVRT